MFEDVGSLMIRRWLAVLFSLMVSLSAVVPLVVLASSSPAGATTTGCSLDISTLRDSFYGTSPFTVTPWTFPDGSSWSGMVTLNCGSAPNPGVGYNEPLTTYQFVVPAGGAFGSWGVSLGLIVSGPAYTVGSPLAVSCVMTSVPDTSASDLVLSYGGLSEGVVGSSCTDSSGQVLTMVGSNQADANGFTPVFDSACPSSMNLGVYQDGSGGHLYELQCSNVDSINGSYAPCSNVEVGGQFGAAVGQSYSYNFQWMGQCTEFVISSAADPAFTQIPPDYTPSLATGGSSTLSYVFDGFTAGNSSGGLFSLAVNLTYWGAALPSGWQSFDSQAEVWAASGQVGALTWYNIGLLASLVSTSQFGATGVAPGGAGSNYGSVGGGASSPPSSFGACVASSGMSLTDPLSWVTGAMEIGRCTLVVLFVPSKSSWDAVVNEFGFSSFGGASGTCGVAPPVMVSGTASQWLGAGFTLIADGPSCAFGAIQSQEAAGATNSFLSQGMTYSSPVTGKSYTVSIPLALASVESNSQFSALATLVLAVLTAVVGVAFFFAIKSLLQRVLGDGGE